ncbi:MAG: isoprenylcysteine carboxylmethyltransferase family protein [Patescibacteria group bacterium]|nr:isoprenylcysteine carboxylmethyltransferase family protein [Patescibacteria group bacterium]
MPNLKYRLASPLLMWVIVAFGSAILWKIVKPGQMFTSGWIGSVVLALGIINFIGVSLFAYNKHRKAPASVHSINQLVTEGAYAVVRHPLYATDIVLAWCIFVWQPSYKVLAIVIWLTLVLVFWANLEERLLEEKFMEDYRAYKKRVPMFVPRLRKK